MKILSIDTTVIAGSVALSEGPTLVVQEQQGETGTHAERLMESIDHMLGLAGWASDEIQAVACAVGPGSFTGLRIGLAVAKGIAYSLGIPIAGASSLTSLAMGCAGADGTVLALIDARRGEIYAAALRVDAAGRMERVTEEFVAPPEAVVERFRSIDGRLIMAGDGALAYEGILRRGLGDRADLAPGPAVRPQALSLALLTHERLARGESDELASLAPNYIRRSDAEIGFMGKGRR